MTSLAPWLSVGDTARAITFLRAAFGATEIERLEDDEGTVQVALLSIAGAEVWIQLDPDASPDPARDGAVRMILTVDDPDAVFAAALEAGATEVAPVGDGNGWHIGRIADPSGHHWEIGRRLGA